MFIQHIFRGAMRRALQPCLAFQLLLCLHATAFASDAKTWIFISDNDLKSIIEARARPPISWAFSNLEVWAENFLKTPKYHVPESGCSLDGYLRGLTYEYGGDAVAIAKLAQYGYMLQLDQQGRNPQVGLEALHYSRKIFLEWARSAFNFGSSSFSIGDFCGLQSGQTGEQVKDEVGLFLGRGVPALVHAYDLLERAGQLSATDEAILRSFLAKMEILIQQSAEFRFTTQHLDCNRFSNHLSVQLAALILLARLRGDDAAVLNYLGSGPAPAPFNWSTQIRRTIYESVTEPLSCFPRKVADDFYQPASAYPGEVNDRFRNKAPQTFHYITLSLTHLYMPLIVIGSKASLSFGEEARRLALAIDYYAPYFRFATANDSVAPLLPATPNSDHYAGKVISNGDCQTLAGRDFMLLPFLLAYGLGRNKGAVAVLAHAFRQENCATLSDLPVPYWGMLLPFDSFLVSNNIRRR